MIDIYEPESLGSRGYTLQEVCQQRCLESSFIIECVDYGITEVSGGEPVGPEEEWLFSLESVRRLEKAWRLQRDLGLDFTGLAIILDLLDDIDRLNDRIQGMSKRLRAWEGQTGTRRP